MKHYRFYGCVLLALLLMPSFSGAACLQSQLKSLLVANAENLSGLNAAVAARQDNSVLDIVNIPREGITYARSKGVITRDEFLGTWVDVITGVDAIADATIRNKWIGLRNILYVKDTIDLDNPTIQGFFAQMINDGLVGVNGALTTSEITARTTRPGSWAELHCGKNLTLDEVSAALNLP